MLDDGSVITHNGGIAGYATLMYGTPDGSKVLTATLTCVDDSVLCIAPAFLKAHGEEDGSTAARLTALVETQLRAAGIRIPSG